MLRTEGWSSEWRLFEQHAAAIERQVEKCFSMQCEVRDRIIIITITLAIITVIAIIVIIIILLLILMIIGIIIIIFM